MTAKNIDLDKLEWSEPEDFIGKTREEFIARSVGHYARRESTDISPFLTYSDFTPASHEGTTCLCVNMYGDKDAVAYYSEWQFAKIPQEEAKETTKYPNPMSMDVLPTIEEPQEEETTLLECPHMNCSHDQEIKQSSLNINATVFCECCKKYSKARDWIDNNEKAEAPQPEEPEWITSETRDGLFAIIESVVKCHSVYTCNRGVYVRDPLGSSTCSPINEFIQRVTNGYVYAIKNPNFKPKKEPKVEQIWTSNIGQSEQLILKITAGHSLDNSDDHYHCLNTKTLCKGSYKRHNFLEFTGRTINLSALAGDKS